MLIETQVEKWDSSSSGPSWRLNLVVKFHLLHHHPRLCKLLNSIYQDTELRGLSNKTNLQNTDGNNRQWSFEIILPSKHIPKSFLSQKSELPKIPHLLNPIVTKSCWFYTPNFSPIIISYLRNLNSLLLGLPNLLLFVSKPFSNHSKCKLTFYVSSFNRQAHQYSGWNLLEHIPEPRDWAGFELVKMPLGSPMHLVPCFMLSHNPTKWNLVCLRPAGVP